VTASESFVIEGCHVATLDDDGTEHETGYLIVDDGRISAVGAGAAPVGTTGIRIDASGCLATPGLVNCHHHLYQSLTRGLAQDANLFEWLEDLYPTWAHIDSDLQYAAARAALASLALSGCSMSSDHHYVFPQDAVGLLEASIEAAATVGLRFHACRGSMDLGRSAGGLPPDDVVEDRDRVLEDTEAAIQKWHDDTFEAMTSVAVAPCSPFSVTRELMRESAELARKHGVRLHTHLAETQEEDEFCRERFEIRPVEYLEELGWLGDDVWLAHCVHLSDDEINRLGAAETGVAHCPSSNARLGAGICRVTDLVASGAPVGLGVDGAASNEAGDLRGELNQALLVARIREGAAAMSVRSALHLATRGGAHCLGRERAVGSLEVGKLADVALWRVDDLGHAGIADPVGALVLGPRRRVDSLWVGGRRVVAESRLQTIDEEVAARELDDAAGLLAERAS
jgi:8-oxoguanine deaminase